MIKAVIFDYEGVVNIHLRLNQQVLEFAKDLKNQGYKTAVLSNMIAPISWFTRKRGDFNSFDPVIISSEVGINKPNPEIYKIAIDRLDLPANECIFIDNHVRNLIPANKLGIKTVHAKNPNQFISEVKALLKN